MTRESGLALVEKYGSEYFRELRKKVKHDCLVKSGRLGGKSFIEKYGKVKLYELSELGRIRFRKRIASDKDFREKLKKEFIKKMKKFTKVYPTKSGSKVRSHLEQEIADFLSEKGVEFRYEPFALPTILGNYEPDFVIKGKVILEVLGMDTGFYLKKKLPKLAEAIKRYPQFKWIILKLPHISVDLTGSQVISHKEDLIAVLQEAS